MTLIYDTSTPNTLEIPVTYAKSNANTGYSITLRNTVSKVSTTVDNLTDASASDFFYKFTINFSQYDKGEYEFELNQSNETLASGIIRIVGGINRDTYSQTVTYKYYES